MIHTELCDLLGIEYPVFQGGMAWIADGKLAAAVSNGGGLGVVAAGNAPADYVRQQIRIAKFLTEKPFGVNIMLMSPFADEVAQVAAEERVAVVTTGAGNPSKYMQLWKDAGIKVIPVVASVAMAKLMTRLGASALIAEGGESGGHVGELTTMVLVPLVCDATTLPVLAAGGIADGRGFAAAMMLGACGVQMGTRFLSAEECNIHPTYKEKILKAATSPRWSPASASAIPCAASAPPLPGITARPNTAPCPMTSSSSSVSARCARLCRTATLRKAASSPARSRPWSRRSNPQRISSAASSSRPNPS